MRFLSFESWMSQKDSLNLIGVEALAFSNERFVIEKERTLFALSYHELDDKEQQPTFYRVQTPKFDALGISIPRMVSNKFICVIEKKELLVISNSTFVDNAFKESDTQSMPAIDQLLYAFWHIIDASEVDFLKLQRVVYDIKKLVTHVDFFEGYKLVEALAILSQYTLNHEAMVQDMMLVLRRLGYKSEFTPKFKERASAFVTQIDAQNRVIEQTRHATMQRIAFLDSGTSRILTIVASVFLPTAFLVSLFLMPLNGVPLRKRKNAYWIFLAAILVIFVIMVTLFRKDFHAVLVG